MALYENFDFVSDVRKKLTNQLARKDGKQRMFPRITGREYLMS